MGIIEERLAQLEAQRQPRQLHTWRLEFAGSAAERHATGNYVCPTCGGWMSGIKDPEKHKEGCPGGPEAWRQLKPGDIVVVSKDPPTAYAERTLVGRPLRILRFSKPHNYAICAELDDGHDPIEWNLHPESLIKKE